MSLPLAARALLGTVLLGVVLVGSVVVSPSASLGLLESVAGNPYRFGLVVAALYAIRPIFAWPTTPLAVVVGYGFGITLGVPIALLGVALTVIPVYLVVRWLTESSADRARVCATLPFGTTLERSHRVVTQYYETAGPFRGVVASRLAPIPSDVATGAAAVSGVRLRHLVAGTVVGEVPWTIAAVVLGASTATLAASVRDTGGLGEYGMALAVICTAAAVVLVAPAVYHLLRTQDGAPTA
ncbi:TVP38/TMEM64 family protein [Natronosalvus vescus]|uniref:TVP38/TMEM64 family protein n=1 Tax=Natronosalvus vescus TaxID=2953881 RepID=UPI0020902189|nr:VTT domain-containing protein [Natronosalvus vescus]